MTDTVVDTPSIDNRPARTRVPRTLIGLLTAPVLMLASELIAPREPSGMSEADAIRFLTDNADRLTLALGVGLLAAAALSATYVMVQQRIRQRGRALATAAATIGVLGAAGLAAHCGSLLTQLDVALHDPTLASAVAATQDGRAVMVTLVPVILGLNLAIVLLSVAAFRARLVPWWTIVLGVLALVADWSPTNYNTVLHAVFTGAVLALIALGLGRGSRPA